jgi:hypothetical protein
MTCEELLPGCFDRQANFAPSREHLVKALDYLRCHFEKEDDWLEVLQEIEAHLRSLEPKVSETQFNEATERARKLLELWLY